ncbi:hypothetical protein R1flu_026683 [Riccia fluitans]|uniref:Uncharacterized protein n=1 Tax=Riccia fluitans TaxID=41844 RepID=A0ABD1XH57_9MARC
MPIIRIPDYAYDREFQQVSPETNAIAQRLSSVVSDLLERRGVPRSFTTDLRRGQENEPPQQRRRLNVDENPTPTEIAAAQVLMSKRTPMIILALLRSVWPTGRSCERLPDAWILAKLWKIIREYDVSFANTTLKTGET